MANEYRHYRHGLVFLDEDYSLSGLQGYDEVVVTNSNGNSFWVTVDSLEKLKLPHSNPVVLTKEATLETNELLRLILAELKQINRRS